MAVSAPLLRSHEVLASGTGEGTPLRGEETTVPKTVRVDVALVANTRNRNFEMGTSPELTSFSTSSAGTDDESEPHGCVREQWADRGFKVRKYR